MRAGACRDLGAEPGRSLADLATIELRRITDVLQVDHASLFLGDADDLERSARWPRPGCPSTRRCPSTARCSRRPSATARAAKVERSDGPGARAPPWPRRSCTTDRALGAPARRHPPRQPAAGRHRLRGRPGGHADAGRALWHPPTAASRASSPSAPPLAPLQRSTDAGRAGVSPARPHGGRRLGALPFAAPGGRPAVLGGSMASTADQSSTAPTDGFRHEALLYAARTASSTATLPWLRDAVAAEEPILVVVSAAKIAAPARGARAPTAERVTFADMAEVGANPARIIPAWREFVDAHTGRGRRLRGIGEPISAERSADELVECQRHEALLNLAFAGAEDFWLLCPYDVDALDARRHREGPPQPPASWSGDGGPHASATYEGLDAVAAPFDEPLPEPPPGADELPFAAGTLAAVRRLVDGCARDGAGSPATRAGDLVLAVNEVATNSIRHGGGAGMLRIWQADGALICEVADAGRSPIRSPGASGRPAASPAGTASGCATRCATSSSCARSPPAASCACTRACGA